MRALRFIGPLTKALTGRVKFISYLGRSGLLKEAVGFSRFKLLCLGIFKIFVLSRIEPVIFLKFKKAKFLLSSGYEISVYDEIFLRRCYEKVSEFSIKDDYLVLDVGANIGIYSVYVSLQNQSCMVYAFEPVSEAVDRLKKNLEANNIRNVRIINEAVWGKSGEIFLEPN